MNEDSETRGWHRVAPAKDPFGNAFWSYQSFTVPYALGEGLVNEDNLVMVNAQVRNRTARAGLRRSEASGEKALFVRPKEIQRDLALYCEAVTTLLASAARPEYVAAWAMYHLLRIHPYSEGNGRMARLLAAHVLCLRGLPFYVAFGVDAASRERMQQAVYAADRGGDVEALAVAIELEVAEAWALFSRTRRAKMAAVMANAARGTAAALVVAAPPPPPLPPKPTVPQLLEQLKGDKSCCICLEDQPDAVSLCCGGVVHFWCLKEMFATSTNCPTCRKTLKRLAPVPVVAGAAPAVSVRGGYANLRPGALEALAAIRDTAYQDLMRISAPQPDLQPVPRAVVAVCVGCSQRGSVDNRQLCSVCVAPKMCAYCRCLKAFESYIVPEWRNAHHLRACRACEITVDPAFRIRLHGLERDNRQGGFSQASRELQIRAMQLRDEFVVQQEEEDRQRQEQDARRQEEQHRADQRRGRNNEEDEYFIGDRCMICNAMRSREYFSRTQWTSKAAGNRKCVNCT